MWRTPRRRKRPKWAEQKAIRFTSRPRRRSSVVAASAEEAVSFRSLHPDELTRQAAVSNKPDLDVGRVRSPERCSHPRQVAEAEAKTTLRCDTNVLTVEMPDDHCALGFARTCNSHVNPISAILGPARSGTAAAAMVVDNVNRFGLRRPRVQCRKRCRNDAISCRVTLPCHCQAFGVFRDALRPSI